MKLRMFIIIAMTISVSAYANEEERAKEACVNASEKAMENEEFKFDLAGMCKMNTRSYDYWACTEKRISNGESYHFATNRCEEETNS